MLIGQLGQIAIVVVYRLQMFIVHPISTMSTRVTQSGQNIQIAR